MILNLSLVTYLVTADKAFLSFHVYSQSVLPSHVALSTHIKMLEVFHIY